jgi:hypothetical protein
MHYHIIILSHCNAAGTDDDTMIMRAVSAWQQLGSLVVVASRASSLHNSTLLPAP